VDSRTETYLRKFAEDFVEAATEVRRFIEDERKFYKGLLKSKSPETRWYARGKRAEVQCILRKFDEELKHLRSKAVQIARGL
jgi:hypothetical protein